MNTDRIERLLEKPCYIIDVLPVTVEREGRGQFFQVEEYLLADDRYRGIRDRFVLVLLKLMCYYHVSVLLEEWIDRPSPRLVEQAVCEIICPFPSPEHDGPEAGRDMGEGESDQEREDDISHTLNVLFPEEDMVLVLERDSLNMSVYNPPKRARDIMEKIAWSEGLFWRESLHSDREAME